MAYAHKFSWELYNTLPPIAESWRGSAPPSPLYSTPMVIVFLGDFPFCQFYNHFNDRSVFIEYKIINQYEGCTCV